MPFTNDEIRTIIRDRPKLALVDDGGHPPFVVDGRHVIDELVEIIKERLPHVPTDDPQARLLTDLHDVLEAILLTPRRRV